MEGLTGAHYTTSPGGGIDIELRFTDPLPEFVDVLEYAMYNHLMIDLPIGGGPVSVRIMTMNLRNETEYVDAPTYGSRPTYFAKVTHRHLVVHARPA